MNEPKTPEPAKLRVDRKQTLPEPIDRGDYTVNKRTLSRVHFSDEGFTCYYQEGGSERGEHREWNEDTIAAFETFLNL